MQGVSAYSEGRYEDSRDALEAAYALVPKPQILYNLAMVEEKLGNTAAACKHLESIRSRWVASDIPPPASLGAIAEVRNPTVVSTAALSELRQR